MIALVAVQVIVLVVLFACSGFFSSAEVAFFSLNPLQVRRLEQDRPADGTRIREILSRPTRLLSTILIGNTIVNVVISVVGYALAERLVPSRGAQIAIPTITILLLIFGEVGPKRLALSRPERLSMSYAPLIAFVMRVVSPLRIMLEKITEKFQYAFRPRRSSLSEEEFVTVVDLSEEHGILDEDEREMVKSIIGLSDLRASDVMTPRVDLVGLDLRDLPEDVVAFVRHAKIRYLLLYQDHADDVVGFLDVRAFLLNPRAGIDAAMIEPFYAPETSPLDKLLAQFLKEHRRIAVVVDEYGGTAGVVTRGDMLEEITGDIDDELAEHKLLFEELSHNRWLVDGRMSLDELNERLDLDLEAEGIDRVAGWVTKLLERLPRPGDVVEHEGYRATVQRMRRHSVEIVLLERAGGPEDTRP